MATLGTSGGGQAVILGTAQSGNADTTNIADRGRIKMGAGILSVAGTAGATPTVTVTVLGSMDGTNFYSIGVALSTTPSTFVASFVITTTSTVYYVLPESVPWRYLKVNYSANTNVTALAATVYPA